jgi:hypothetical protein
MLGYLYGKTLGSKIAWIGPCYFSSQTFSHINTPTSSTAVILYTYSPMKMEQTECSETLAFKLHTPVNHPEEIIRSLYNSATNWFIFPTACVSCSEIKQAVPIVYKILPYARHYTSPSIFLPTRVHDHLLHPTKHIQSCAIKLIFTDNQCCELWAG